MGGRFERTEQIAAKDAEPEFEYDPNKSASNKEKHGIDFEVAKALWNDDRRVRILSRYKDEPREMMIAKYDGKEYIAVYTMRENRIRLISVRRARDDEVNIYEASENDS